MTTDWSQSVRDLNGSPAMGGAGHARIGQVARRSKHHWVIGRLLNQQSSLGVATWGNATHFDYSVLVMQRHMERSVLEKVRRARANGVTIINDVDDWFWGLHPENAAHAMTDPKKNTSSNIDIYKETIRLSNVVVVSTPFLAKQIQNWWVNGPEVVVIENGVEADSFVKRRQTRGTVTVGWAGSTAHRSGDLEVLRLPFSELKDVRFFHLGANPDYPTFHSKVGISKSRVGSLPMLSPHEYPYGLKFDIGVVPLVDIPFNHAKSNIKGLEYAAAGIPFVASPLPEYVRLAEEHGIGRLAKTTRDWVREIKALCDYDTRAAEAVRQRQAVRELSARKQAREWDELIWGLA